MSARLRYGQVFDCGLALAAIALIIVLGAKGVFGLGITATALLLTLPVLWAASRGSALIGAMAALIASVALNYFLLPPLYTFQIHGATYVVTFAVFTAVALVTGGFAAGLRARRDEAARRAQGSEFETDFVAEIALASSREDLDRRALAMLGTRFGDARLFTRSDLAARTSGLAPLDASAAIWALEHEAVTGFASDVMPGADFRFVSFGRGSQDVLALATELLSSSDAPFLLRVAGHWGHARDHLQALEERRRREDAEARDRTRRALLSALGHDFRTPLTVLKEGLARLPGAREAGLLAEVERLRHLGEDLLASARLDAGLPLAFEPVDLVDTIASMQAQAARQANGIVLDARVPDDLPLVRAEPVMLAHLLGNVLDNALRHARERVEISCLAEDDVVTVLVSDDGPGVPPELAETIFDPFVSGDRTEARGGSGLGLAIAHDLAGAMGGSLTLDRPDDSPGAVFRLSLPVAAARSLPE